MSAPATPHSSASRSSGFGALLWLAVATFSMGIDGYVLAGLLPQIADDLNVAPAAAGQLVAIFALTSAVSGPILGTLTGGWERKTTIAASLAVFVIGNVIVAIAPIYGVAIAGRVASALGAALLNAVISAYVVATTPPERRGRALSFVMGGWLTASALGVPVGLLLGQTSWRIPLLLVAAVGTVALVGVLLRLPRLHLPRRTLRETLQPLRDPRLLTALLVPTGIMCASYLCFTYATLIVGPRVGGGYLMIIVMFGYGMLSLLGNIITGRLVDRHHPVRVITGILSVLVFAALAGAAGLLLPGGLGVIAALLWFATAAIGNGGSGVPLQARLSGMAPESAALVFALNGSAMALGSGLGSGLGGLSLELGVAPDRLLLVSAAVLAVTFAVHLAVGRRRAAAPLTPLR